MFIVTDARGIEQGYLKADFDIDIGDQNDFEITMPLTSYQSSHVEFGSRFYPEATRQGIARSDDEMGSEYGGIIEDMEPDTKNNTIKLLGYTWRGLLGQKIIMSSGPYSGDANDIIRQIVGNAFDNLYVVDAIKSGISVENYSFDGYPTMLDGFHDMLGEEGKLCCRCLDGVVHLTAEKVVDYSNEYEYSQDNRISFTVKDYRRGINHLVVIGKDVIGEPVVVHVYADELGNISTTQTLKGLAERMQVYEYTSLESKEALVEAGKKRLKELMNYKKLEISVEDMEADVGDIVGGRERITGITLKRPIKSKILKITDGKLEIEYQVEGEEDGTESNNN